MADSTATHQLIPQPSHLPTNHPPESGSRNTAKVPVVIHSRHSSMNPEILKFILPKKYTISRLLSLIRKARNYGPEEAVYFYAENKILAYDSVISDVYHRFKGQDGFLYLTMSNIPAFG